ncbi:IclR family transcriptional regulator [Rhodococcus sp. ACPA4]|jgi:DNA-binding IclR family transcriptional regulator|uniref:IclR family transcriptional regulator n=1 Tax=Rhodococcus TaxID=1827 RepID=UPI0005D43A53|nr:MULTISPECIES: helix-turn-helix domain-containing protein [Rhodococcus]KJF24013.1 Solvent efflux pump srpABC operon corepressor [Rhodococcus sp. AD45]PBC42841.1 IclR family transcriptional regulator [Rhodococcus sp. ACPA4]PSR42364.1 IclR family transcriptional regulator [Rhodococcus sp. AD45-ID]QXW05127.1 helix-turn-helix domain-containing protein [Rhodococcus globerulus]ROZ50106.1 IclR family transcriptional regulator [Rhodococcus sp. WS3]
MRELSDDHRPRISPVQVDSGMSKTLHHGLEILELLTSYPHGLSVTDIADGIGVHRTVAHRLIRTLEAHHLCRKDTFKRVTLGAGLVTLAEPVEQDLRTLARPILEELADATEATAHLVVRESETEVRALMVVEPRSARMHVAFRPGQVDPIDRGSAGLSMLASLPPVDGERDEVRIARARGYASTIGEITPSVHGISAAVPGRRGDAITSIGISAFHADDQDALGAEVIAAAQKLGSLLR